MILAVLLATLAAIWLCAAAALMALRDLPFNQALAYAPLRLFFSIDDRATPEMRRAPVPVVYVVVHQSRLDPALMLSLLPSDTLHILDEASARSVWLRPFRRLARTVAFNTEHVFVSRRLVRVLKGDGRLAVYLPSQIEPDAKSFRLYRAIARIAVAADARIMPVMVGGAGKALGSLDAQGSSRISLFRKLRVTAPPAATLDARLLESGIPGTHANALFDALAEARIEAADRRRDLFSAVREASDLFGASATAIEDTLTGALSYRRLFIAARILGARIAGEAKTGEAVGLMLPNANAAVVSLLALFSAGRPAAMINYTAGMSAVGSAIQTAGVKLVVSSKAFVAKAELQPLVEAIEAAGARIYWLEDMRARVGLPEKLWAAVFWRRPLRRTSHQDTAVIVFTSGSEGMPKGVVLSHGNLLSNALQVAARLELSPADKLLNVLPIFHSYGLTGGTILPLLVGVPALFYPSPLHYKEIPKLARKARPTIMFGTDTFLAGYARAAEDKDFESLRLVVAGAEPVRAETRRVWKERFGASIMEGYGFTEASPVAALNTHTHGRDGTVGRPLPMIRLRLDAVEGVSNGQRLQVSGPNIMQGYLLPNEPGRLVAPADGWHDSGDIVYVDRDGFLSVRGRAKRFAKIGGEMVSLGAVETLAASFWPAASHAAAVLPDRRKGERIVLVTTEADADLGAFRQFARNSGATELMIPHAILTVDELPMLGTGKIDHAGVSSLAAERLAQPAA